MAIISPITNATTPTTLIFKGGRVYDAKANKIETMDLKIQNGKIAAKGKNLEVARTDTVRMLNENDIVTPGGIDLHTHYFGCWGNKMDPIAHGLYKGVTLQVDAGSSGMSTFEDFNKYTLKNMNGMLIAMLNISPAGLAQQTGENWFLTNHSVQKTAELAIANPDTIKIIKIRNGPTQNATEEIGIRALEMAKEAARLAGGLPVMVHIEDGSPLEKIFNMLDADDIVTHAFRKNPNCNILDEGNRLKPFVLSALQRGVRFDIGHGYGGFDKDNVLAGMGAIVAAELLSNANYRPFTTSTDLHCFSLETPAKSLPDVVAKMISLGMTKEDAIASITRYPAEALRLPESRWRMDIGDEANLTVWEHDFSVHPFVDSNQNQWNGNEMLNPTVVYVNKQLIDIAA
jgi:dihydroorotase